MASIEELTKVLFVHIPGTSGSTIKRSIYESAIDFRFALVNCGILNDVHTNYNELVTFFEYMEATPEFKFTIVRNPMTRIASMISRRTVRPAEFLDGTAKLTQPKYGQIEMLEGAPDDLQIFKYETQLRELYNKLFHITGRLGSMATVKYPKTTPMNVILGTTVMRKVIEQYEPEFTRFGYDAELAEYKSMIGM